jgi:nuclear transport factor 2 (NTF2) superfamily protein
MLGSTDPRRAPMSDAPTRDEATRLVAAVEAAFAAGDVDRIVAGYTDDVVIRFADFPEMRGIDAARAFLDARFARQLGYQLRKRLRAVDGNVIGNSWEGTWTDARTGKSMQGRGVEFWTMRDGKVAEWEAAFNVNEVDAGPGTPLT